MADCGAKVKEGVSVTPLREDDVYKIHTQCLTYNGKFVKLVKGDPTRFRPIPLTAKDNGIYTYLFDQDGKLHTAKVANRFEIGSLHMTLAFVADVSRVLASGELKKTGNTIDFNLISGTYMKDWMDGTCDTEIRTHTKELFERALPGMEITYTGETFITDGSVPVTREQLHSYLDAGFEVRLYDDAKDCKPDEGLLQARLAAWEKTKQTGPAVERAKADLERTKNYTLYTRAGRKKTRRVKKRSTRRRRRV